MKVVVLGAGGMLGHKMLQALSARFPGATGTLVGAHREGGLARVGLFDELSVIERVDVTDHAAIAKLLGDLRPDVVVNCVGVIKQRPAAHDAIASIAINALFPHQLAALCAEWQGRVIHFSTDCVFSGKRGRYTEDDAPDAEDLYGRSKFLGEVASPNALTLRTSIIGRELVHFQSLLEWFLVQEAPIRGFTRALYAGVTTNHLASVVGDIIAHHPTLTGLYQVASETISKYDLLCLLREAWGKKIEVVRDETFACDRSFLGDKLFGAIGYRSPPWPELVAELAKDPTPYERWR